MKLLIKLISKSLKRFNFKINYFLDQDYFDFKKFIYSYSINRNIIKFVQIGGNDGVINDPIYDLCKKFPNKFHGHIFEPVKEYFHDLKNNYNFSKNISFYNLAIHNSLKTTTIHKVKKKYLNKVDSLAKGIASFEKNWWKTKSNFIKDPEMMEEVNVNCVDVNFITEKLNLDFIDILIVDTEGYDYEILKKFNFNKFKPAIIHFEHGINDGLMSKDQLIEIKNILIKNEYELIYQNYDLTAYQMKKFIN